MRNLLDLKFRDLTVKIGTYSANTKQGRLLPTLRLRLLRQHLDGPTLDITLLDRFIPTAGNTYAIIEAANILDSFDTIILPSLPGNLLWLVNQKFTSLKLVLPYAADSDDQGVWVEGFGSAPATYTTGDANADTLVGVFGFQK